MSSDLGVDDMKLVIRQRLLTVRRTITLSCIFVLRLIKTTPGKVDSESSPRSSFGKRYSVSEGTLPRPTTRWNAVHCSLFSANKQSIGLLNRKGNVQ